MGYIGEMFRADTKTEVEVNELYNVLRMAAKGEMLSNAINNGVTLNDLIKMNNDREGAKKIIEEMEAEWDAIINDMDENPEGNKGAK